MIGMTKQLYRASFYFSTGGKDYLVDYFSPPYSSLPAETIYCITAGTKKIHTRHPYTGNPTVENALQSLQEVLKKIKQ